MTTGTDEDYEDKDNYWCQKVKMMMMIRRKSRKTTTRIDDDKDYCGDEIMTYAVLVILEFWSHHKQHKQQYQYNNNGKPNPDDVVLYPYTT